jgi:general secretion pathway protein A
LNFFQQQGNLALIIGQTGTGKSSLLRLFLHHLPLNRFRHLYLHITPISPNAFLRLIVTTLGEAPKFGKDRLFLQLIDRINQSDLLTILVIDEAHLIPSQALTDLRLLISSGIHPTFPLKIILSGQDTLSLLLKRSAHADLVNRISVQFRINPLSKDQTGAYIDHRLRCADAPDKIFDSEAKSIIHDYSGGIPRLINNIATACLINAASKNLKKVSDSLVNETMSEFHLP